MEAEIHGLDLQKRQIFDEGLPSGTLQSAGIYFRRVKLKKKKETLSLLIEGTIDGKDFAISEEGRHFPRIVDGLREKIFSTRQEGLEKLI